MDVKKLRNARKEEKSHITEYANDAVRFIRCGQIKKIDFSKNIPFLATGKLHLSTYQCTPSGNLNFSLGSVCRFQSFFPIPLKKWAV